MYPQTSHDDPPPSLPLDIWQTSSAIQPNGAEKKAQAVTELLRNKSLIHTFGQGGKYEVRTTIATRQAWRYRCSVRRDGKEITKGFCPVEVDLTDQLRQERSVTEAMRVAFATAAVEDHFALCAAVSEYDLLAAIYAEPLPSPYKAWQITFVGLILAVLVTTYWFWRNPSHADPPPQLSATAAQHIVQWAQNPMFYEYPAGKQFAFRLPELARMPPGLPIEVSLDLSGQQPSWIHFDREMLLISGTAPLTGQARTYPLIFRARAQNGGESQLRAYLTITPSIEVRPAPESSARKPSASERLPEKDCLLNILKGEPCQNR